MCQFQHFFYFASAKYFPSALFPKLWNSIELGKSAELFKRKIFKNSLDSYASYICKKITVFCVDKLSHCYLLHPVIHKHDSNNICYPLLQPFSWVPTLSLILFHPSFIYSWFDEIWLGGSKLHSKLWFFICIISCFVVE